MQLQAQVIPAERLQLAIDPFVVWKVKIVLLPCIGIVMLH